MSSITESASAPSAYSPARSSGSEAARALREQNEQQQQASAESAAREEDRRQARKIPGMGEAVDISV